MISPNQYVATQAMKDAVSDGNVKLTSSNASLFAKIQDHLERQSRLKGDSFWANCYRDVARVILEAAELKGIQITSTLQINEYALSLNEGSLTVHAAFPRQVQALEDIRELPRELLLKTLFHGELLAK